VGGFGLAVWFVLHRIPPGAGFGSLRASAEAFAAHGLVAAMLVFCTLLGIFSFFVCNALDARWRLPPGSLRFATAPLIWGAAVPTASLVLDAAFFWSSAPPLAALGLGLGALLSWRRLARLELHGAAGGRDPSRALLAGLAVVLPMVLLSAGWTPPNGDEPNYLTVAHSLVTDGDLDLSDDYRDRVYAPYHPAVISPHYRPGLAEGSRYSMHGIGLPVLIAPAYALGRMFGPGATVALPRATLLLLYGLFAWVLYGFVGEISSTRAARYGTAATTLLAPLLFAPLFLFSETPAMLLLLVAFRGLSKEEAAAGRHGWALAALPFMGVKYIPVAGAIFLVGVWAALPERRLSRALRCGTPLAVGLLLHALLTWRLYGSLSPVAIYLGAGDQAAGAPALGGDWAAYVAAWPAAMATAIGYLLDQKEGLLAYGPHFLLSFAGLAWFARHRAKLLVSLGLVVAAYVGPYALSQQLSGQGPPVRPMLAILWVLAPALGVALALATGCRAYGALRGALLALSASLTLAYAAQPQLLPHDYPVLASRLLQNYSPYGSGWWRLFPQWVNIEDPNRLVTGVWTLAVALLAAALWRHGWRLGNADGIAAPAARSDDGAWRVGWKAAVMVFVAACLLVLIHHAAVVRTDRHRPTLMDSGLVAWVADELPPVAYAEAGGVWAKPGGPVDFLITYEAPLESLDVSLRVLVPGDVYTLVQGARMDGPASPGANEVARLRPGPGHTDGSGYAYHVRLWAGAGAAPADLVGGEDERYLGVFFHVSALRERGREGAR
jgi:hypothetical protein